MSNLPLTGIHKKAASLFNIANPIILPQYEKPIQDQRLEYILGIPEKEVLTRIKQGQIPHNIFQIYAENSFRVLMSRLYTIPRKYEEEFKDLPSNLSEMPKRIIRDIKTLIKTQINEFENTPDKKYEAIYKPKKGLFEEIISKIYGVVIPLKRDQNLDLFFEHTYIKFTQN